MDLLHFLNNDVKKSDNPKPPGEGGTTPAAPSAPKPTNTPAPSVSAVPKTPSWMQNKTPTPPKAPAPVTSAPKPAAPAAPVTQHSNTPDAPTASHGSEAAPTGASASSGTPKFVSRHFGNGKWNYHFHNDLSTAGGKVHGPLSFGDSGDASRLHVLPVHPSTPIGTDPKSAYYHSVDSELTSGKELSVPHPSGDVNNPLKVKVFGNPGNQRIHAVDAQGAVFSGNDAKGKPGDSLATFEERYRTARDTKKIMHGDKHIATIKPNPGQPLKENNGNFDQVDQHSNRLVSFPPKNPATQFHLEYGADVPEDARRAAKGKKQTFGSEAGAMNRVQEIKNHMALINPELGAQAVIRERQAGNSTSANRGAVSAANRRVKQAMNSVTENVPVPAQPAAIADSSSAVLNQKPVAPKREYQPGKPGTLQHTLENQMTWKNVPGTRGGKPKREANIPAEQLEKLTSSAAVEYEPEINKMIGHILKNHPEAKKNPKAWGDILTAKYLEEPDKNALDSDGNPVTQISEHPVRQALKHVIHNYDPERGSLRDYLAGKKSGSLYHKIAAFTKPDEQGNAKNNDTVGIVGSKTAEAPSGSGDDKTYNRIDQQAAGDAATAANETQDETADLMDQSRSGYSMPDDDEEEESPEAASGQDLDTSLWHDKQLNYLKTAVPKTFQEKQIIDHARKILGSGGFSPTPENRQKFTQALQSAGMGHHVVKSHHIVKSLESLAIKCMLKELRKIK